MNSTVYLFSHVTHNWLVKLKVLLIMTMPPPSIHLPSATGLFVDPHGQRRCFVIATRPFLAWAVAPCKLVESSPPPDHLSIPFPLSHTHQKLWGSSSELSRCHHSTPPSQVSFHLWLAQSPPANLMKPEEFPGNLEHFNSSPKKTPLVTTYWDSQITLLWLLGINLPQYLT